MKRASLGCLFLLTTSLNTMVVESPSTPPTDTIKAYSPTNTLKTSTLFICSSPESCRHPDHSTKEFWREKKPESPKEKDKRKYLQDRLTSAYKEYQNITTFMNQQSLLPPANCSYYGIKIIPDHFNPEDEQKKIEALEEINQQLRDLIDSTPVIPLAAENLFSCTLL